MNPDHVLDLTGLKCPLPAIKMKRYLRGLAPGDSLEVICDDPLAEIDIPSVLLSLGHTLAKSDSHGERLHFWITVNQGRPGSEDTWPVIGA
jgi:tRNA 2-thiouridine synthesizing protein A